MQAVARIQLSISFRSTRSAGDSRRTPSTLYNCEYARVAELADAPDLGFC